MMHEHQKKFERRRLRFRRFQLFREDDVGVSLRSAFDGVFPLISHALIEPWRLETVCREHQLDASASGRLCFSGTKEQCSEPLSTVLLMHPDMRELTAAAP